MPRHLLGVVVLLAAAVSATAEPPTLVKLTLLPAPAPTPALKYQLLPELRDTTPGNAAYLYQRSHSPEWMTFRRDPNFLKYNEWVNLAPEELPRDKLNWLLTSSPLRELDRAARREYCDWELTSRLRDDGFGLLLPDVQGFREFALLLALRARLHMADGQYDKAVYTLQTGFALGRHLGESPTLIGALVGIAISQIMCNQVELLLQRPGAPNLYWALTMLPQRFLDLRKPIQGERIVLDAELPQFRNLDKAPPLHPRQQEELVEKVLRMRVYLLDDYKSPAWQRRLELAAEVARLYPEAKKALFAEGRGREEVEALPPLQVVLINVAREFYREQENRFKWYYVSYPDGLAGLEQAARDYRQAPDISIRTLGFSQLLPAVQKAFFASARLDRRIAALRCVEAVRLYAAAHDGKFPAALTDVKEVPLPDDPVTGKPFEYKRDGDRATLYAPPPPGQEALSHNTLFYELNLPK